MRPYAQAMVDAARSAGLFLYFFESGLRWICWRWNTGWIKTGMADLGMTLNDLTSQMGLFVSEGYVTRYDERGRAYRVSPAGARFESLARDAAGYTGITAPVSEFTLATLQRNTEPRALTRFQQKSFKLFGGVIRATPKSRHSPMLRNWQMKCPPGYRLDYTGSRDRRNTMVNVLGVGNGVFGAGVAVQQLP